MHMSGEQRIAASREKVWQGLNDPEVLRQCIPGCQALEKEADNRFAAIAEVKIGPIGARFKGNVQLSDLDPSNGYTITGSGSGGIAGNAKGSARVRLTDDPSGGTLVSYTVDAEVGGRMAQLGGPIIDATAKNLAGKFFARFGEVVSGAESAAPQPDTPAFDGPAPAAPPAASVLVSPRPVAGSSSLWGWVAAIVLALLAGFTLGIRHQHATMMIVLVALIVTAAAAYEAGRRGGRS